eukprot:g2313.t1
MGAGASILSDAETESVKSFLRDENKLRELWSGIDREERGYASLPEIIRALSNTPGFSSVLSGPEVEDSTQFSTPVIRAYKATCYGSGRPGDDFVERGVFHLFLRNVFYFHKLWQVFNDIDSSNDGAVTLEEFKAGLVQLKISDGEDLFEEIDGADKKDGKVLFNELCKYAARHLLPDIAVLKDTSFEKAPRKPPRKLTCKRRKNPAGLPYEESKVQDSETFAVSGVAVTQEEFDNLQKRLDETMRTEEDLRALWKSLDSDNSGKVTLNEVDALVSKRFPILNNKPALMRAFKKTAKRGADGNFSVEYPNGLRTLIGNIFWFNRLWSEFSEVDTSGDRRLDFGEFVRASSRLHLGLDITTCAKEFDDLDELGCGTILFDEFCVWIAAEKYKK